MVPCGPWQHKQQLCQSWAKMEMRPGGNCNASQLLLQVRECSTLVQHGRGSRAFQKAARVLYAIRGLASIPWHQRHGSTTVHDLLGSSRFRSARGTCTA